MKRRTQLMLAAAAATGFLGATLAPGTSQNAFPLAAPAGVDSNARQAPPGAVNQGPFDVATWKYGNGVHAAAGRQDLESGQDQADAGRQARRRHGLGGVDPDDLLRDGECRLRFHLDRDAARKLRPGPTSRRRGKPARTPRRFPACASPYTDEREIQHALDGGALVLVVPTVDTVEEATRP